MTITEFKFAPEYLAERLAQLQEQVGASTPLLPIFVEQTRKVLAQNARAYLRYGPYWWAVKRVLRANDVDVGGTYDEPMWADEYAVKGADGEVSAALTLLSAWEFGDDHIGRFGVTTREYDLDGTTFLLFDQDQETRGK